MRTVLTAVLSVVMMGHLCPIGAAEVSGKIVLSLNDLLVKGKEEINHAAVQKVVENSFRLISNVEWRTLPTVPERSNEFILIFLKNFSTDSFPEGHSPCVTHNAIACVALRSPYVASRHRIFISLEGAKELLYKRFGPSFQVQQGRLLSMALGQLAAHEIAHLLLGLKEKHEKVGLFAGTYSYVPDQTFSPSLTERLRRAIVLAQASEAINTQIPLPAEPL